jgi:alkanesulfonate monooxygenase SsuD/methylene tetrahydromethanopterin reductase-like flavin-dependent oxidoreductase (luciferase family)
VRSRGRTADQTLWTTRFVAGLPRPSALPTAVWINKPKAAVVEPDRDSEPEVVTTFASRAPQSPAADSPHTQRRLRFGYRVHMIVRETEAEARAYARRLVSRLDTGTGDMIRRRSLDHASIGVQRQAEMRDAADDEGFVEEHLWTGIGRARSGCGAALVGNPDQVVAKLRAYIELGIESFILSGYPHAAECDHVGRYVLPALKK